MEFEKIMAKYKSHSPKEFFKWLSKGKVIEVRFLNDYNGVKFANWDLIRILSTKLKLPYRYNSLFITSYEELKDILLYRYNNFPLTRIYNIFVGVNPKRKVFYKNKNGLISETYNGSIASTSHIQNILCDIEHKKRTGPATEAELEDCIQAAKYLVKVLELKSYWINISGNGSHLWFDLDKEIELPMPKYIEYENKIKYCMKQDPIVSYVKTYNRFIEKLDTLLQKFNTKLKVDDGAKDIARIARPPGSWNIKRKDKQRCVGTVANELSLIKYNWLSFMAAKPVIKNKYKKIVKISETSRKHRYNKLNIRECPLYQLLVSEMLPSILSRNHYLEQSFAKILRDNEIAIEEIGDVIEEMNSVQNKNVQVDPDYLDNDEPFNPEMVNTYCFDSKIPFIYEILENVPEIPTEKVNLVWDKISDESIKLIAINILKPADYIKLKALIRKLIDADYSRQRIFLSLKAIYKNDWLYYRDIIIKIMNKTRKQLK